MVEFSIVMAFHNRKPQLLRTLKTIGMSSKIDETEVIIVNDGSAPEHDLSDVPEMFDFPIIVIDLPQEKKWYVNPCVPYNVGFKAASGEVIIIQNPECMHVGDIIAHVDENLGDDNYISYAAYSLNQPSTNGLDNIELNAESVKEHVHPLAMMPYTKEGSLGWYNHSVIRPKGYHFCAAITSYNLLDELGGFDERYATGIAFDDDELMARIGRLGLDIEIYDEPMVIHQWHTSGNSFMNNGVDGFWDRFNHNQNLYNNVTLKETIYKANTK